MKIAIDARLWGLENAGLGRYTINLIQSLAELDHKNEYFILLRKKYYKELSFPKNFIKVEADYQHYSLAEQYRLSRLLKKLNPDLVHFLHFNVPVPFKGKFVVTLHDLIMHLSRGRKSTTQPSIKYQVKRLGYKLVFKHAVNGSTKIIVPSNFVASELVKFYKTPKAKIKVIYEGVEKKTKTPNIRSEVLSKYEIDKPYFIYAGNAYPHKNLERAIEAVIQLNNEIASPVLLVIVCSRNVFTKRLEKYIAKNDAGKHIKLLGFVPDTDLDLLYKNSVSFLYPSIYEGFGLPGLEALENGTLVICSDIPVFREIYKDAVSYFNPFDFTSISKAMKKVLEIDKKERKIIIDKGYLQTEKYSWERMATQTLAVYENSSSLRQS